MSSVAVMQPTFLPWLGYFALMHMADDFVFLDDVQFSKQSWQSRNKIKGPNGPVTLSLPISRDQSKPLISEVRLADTGFEKKLLRSVEGALKKAPHYFLVQEILGHAIEECDGQLAKLNQNIICAIATAVGITTRVHSASTLAGSPQGREDRLLAMCQDFGANEYLSPLGSLDYLKEYNPFDGAATELKFLNFVHPIYEQLYPPFLSHMGAIDALANVGPNGFLDVVNAGLLPSLTISQIQDLSHAAV